MAKIELYRLVDNAEDCRYLGTFEGGLSVTMKPRLLDAQERFDVFGVSDEEREETGLKVLDSVVDDYVDIDRNLPICCAEHERFLNSLIEAATSGSPVQLGPQHQPGHPIDQGRSGRPNPPSR